MLSKCKSWFLWLFASLVVSSPVLAAGENTGKIDFSTLTNAISFADVIAAIMAIAVGIVGLYLAQVGVKKLVQFLRSA